MPWTISKGEIVEFFKGFEVLRRDITLDVVNGKISGFAVVKMRDEKMAQKAILELNQAEIGCRWIGVC